MKRLAKRSSTAALLAAVAVATAAPAAADDICGAAHPEMIRFALVANLAPKVCDGFSVPPGDMIIAMYKAAGFSEAQYQACEPTLKDINMKIFLQAVENPGQWCSNIAEFFATRDPLRELVDVSQVKAK